MGDPGVARFARMDRSSTMDYITVEWSRISGCRQRRGDQSPIPRGREREPEGWSASMNVPQPASVVKGDSQPRDEHLPNPTYPLLGDLEGSKGALSLKGSPFWFARGRNPGISGRTMGRSWNRARRGVIAIRNEERRRDCRLRGNPFGPGLTGVGSAHGRVESRARPFSINSCGTWRDAGNSLSRWATTCPHAPCPQCRCKALPAFSAACWAAKQAHS